MKHICRSCSRIDDVRFVKMYKYKRKNTIAKVRVYRDSLGKKIYDSECFICYQKRYRKNLGHTSRDESKKPNIVSAVRSEKIAQKRFEDLGFTVERTVWAGPDLICRIGKLVWTVEVKRAALNGQRWRTHIVCKNRRKDDLIAIVLPNNYVYIESMKNHLKHCVPSDGTRAVWPIVKEFGLKPLKTT